MERQRPRPSFTRRHGRRRRSSAARWGTLHKTVTENGMKKTALIVVGGCLGGEYLRSLLYHPDFTTEYRKGKA